MFYHYLKRSERFNITEMNRVKAAISSTIEAQYDIKKSDNVYLETMMYYNTKSYVENHCMFFVWMQYFVNIIL